MFRHLALFSCGLGLSALAAVAAPLVGRMDGENYVSPTAQFRIRAPVLPELGGVISDTENVVTFQDNYGTHISVACFPMDASQRWEFDTRGLRDYLLFFFTDVVMPNFASRFRGSAVESARFLPDLQGGALIGYALLPGGSHFEHLNRVLDGPPADPAVAKRGTLVFVRDRHVYAISTELAERVTQRSTYKLTKDEEDVQLTNRLTAILGRISVTHERPRTP
ncbi:MAG: hypothetical protein QG602_1622 [Verrucomicrobiota bacterium]|nr:hypothetical protein [Verrucomicrobiota bacterium]